ncbi:MAG: response regulator [Prolixibacteraceae bacterium]|jgi:CheY-like chemotaxis protein|nr:response regulator [Prolixibacteraceae bacterium]MBT6765310.1 response regulator [Prolixibacteraceae bacterium]MBT6997016.1 response regulator [Prolixibacteraceae bacterium]MBT7396702.1 response regulator [Prolixibacteraceae bacterium]
MSANYKNPPILLVEDNPMDIDLTLRAFKKRNLINAIQVDRDGAEALGRIDKWDAGEQQPIVILLDLNMPKVDGLEVLKIIKEHPKYCTIPIVVLTSSSDSTDIEKAYKLGANSYIVKPVNFDKFVEVAAQIELYWNALNKPID